MRFLLKCILVAAICLFSLTAKTQILQDSAAINIITRGMHNIYNLEFEEAMIAYDAIAKLYPQHPVLHLFNGMKIYWENFPLIPSSSERIQFESEMRTCIEQSDKKEHPSQVYEAEYLLSNICARGLLLLFMSDNDLSGDVVPLVTSTYRPLMRSFSFASAYPDFYYFTGVYNYYREAYPQVYPVYKTVAFLFPNGDMEKGLQQLEICGKKSMALRAEAVSLLYWIRMNFETNFEASMPYSRNLAEEYPSNPLYKVYYIKNLLLLKQYEEAEKLISENGREGTNTFYLAVSDIFSGIIKEKKYHNNALAQDLYKRGIGKLAIFGAYGNEYAAYGYFGLSRTADESEDKHERKANRRKGMDLVDFKKITFDE